MSEFVKISEGGKVEQGEGGVPLDFKVGRVVPIGSNIKQGSMSRTQITDGDGATHEQGSRSVRVSSRGNESQDGLNFRDQHDRPVRDIRKVTDDCSVNIGNTRVSVAVALNMGLIAVDGQGNYSLVEQSAQESTQQQAPEPVAFKEDIETLQQFDSRVPRSMTDSYISQIMGNIVSGKASDGLISDYASAVGATPESIKNWSEDYANNLLASGLDMTVRASGGKYSSEEIIDYIDGTSNDYKRQLLLSMHYGNRGAIKELLSNLRQRKAV